MGGEGKGQPEDNWAGEGANKSPCVDQVGNTRYELFKVHRKETGGRKAHCRLFDAFVDPESSAILFSGGRRTGDDRIVRAVTKRWL